MEQTPDRLFLLLLLLTILRLVLLKIIDALILHVLSHQFGQGRALDSLMLLSFALGEELVTHDRLVFGGFSDLARNLRLDTIEFLIGMDFLLDELHKT